jgi:prostaglandin-endoperoxide synthase 2
MFQGLPAWLVKLVLALAARWKWLGSKINAIAINSTVNVCRHRPHPWSTAHDYVSWTSLSDQRFSARHLPAAYPQDLPDPALIKELFRRPAGKQRLCEKSTCLFPAFAQYLTDGFIRTRMVNKSKGEPPELVRQNTSNHQIDLCTLYGRIPEHTHALRLNSEEKGKRGRLKSQLIGGEEYSPFLFNPDGSDKPEFAALDRFVGLDNVPSPAHRAHLFACGGDRVNTAPQVVMINTLLLREHNRLAGEIEKRNPGWDDERVFQTARNTVIVMFIKIVVEEYINHIAPSPFRLRADASIACNAPWNKPNWITTEFSLLYRWHSLLPDTIAWGGTTYPLAATLMDNRILVGAGLARSFQDLSAQRAGQLGARNTADALLHIEILSLNQGRICNLDSYAAYRKYVSLPPPGSFEDVSSDPDVVALLRDLYKDPARIEFYVGLFAEDPVPNSPLPLLILKMVAVDAFSQALTNPLLSEHVFNEGTFSEYGWNMIARTATLRDLLERNSPVPLGDAPVGMTRAGWQYRW